MRRRGFLGLVMAPGELAGADLEEVTTRLAPLFGHDLADQPPVVNYQLAAMRACDLTAPQSADTAELLRRLREEFQAAFGRPPNRA